ncbi:MAG: TRAP transporter permease, partial [Pseudohongiellaceae bacterium]
AFAAAGIAGTPPMATGLTSWKVSKGLYLVPLLFAYSPLITGTWLARFEVFGWSCLGLYALAGCLHWYLETRLNLLTAAMLFVSAVLMMWMPLDNVWHFVGGALLAGVIFWQRKSRATAPTPAL